MRLLVTGAGGLLGSNVVAVAIAADHHVTGTYHTTEPLLEVPCHQLDIRDTDKVRRLLKDVEPTAVINCAAMTDVDVCEIHPERADDINGREPGELATLCDERDIQFAHISTDYVFSGETESKYVENDDPDPIQAYGRSKLLGERLVRENHTNPVITRLSFVYGVHGATGGLEGFPAWVISRLGVDERVPLFTDQHITPSRAGQAAQTLLELIESEKDGTYHVACDDCVSPYEFGKEICELVSADGELLELSTMADVSRPAPRPTRTCLDVGRIEESLDRLQPGFTDDLRAIQDKLRTVLEEPR